jgi:hypothetical protein
VSRLPEIDNVPDCREPMLLTGLHEDIGARRPHRHATQATPRYILVSRLRRNVTPTASDIRKSKSPNVQENRSPFDRGAEGRERGLSLRQRWARAWATQSRS